MALATNGTYTFLTDDSGIGNPHIKPTTDEWEVEFLNDLLVRLINQYVVTPTCDNTIEISSADVQNDTVFVNYPDIDVNLVDTMTTDSVYVTNDPNNQADTNQVSPDPFIEQTLKIYPNPTKGNLTVEVSGAIEEFYLCDLSGKILERHIVDDQTELHMDIGGYPQGVYFLRYFSNDILKSGKIILVY